MSKQRTLESKETNILSQIMSKSPQKQEIWFQVFWQETPQQDLLSIRLWCTPLWPIVKYLRFSLNHYWLVLHLGSTLDNSYLKLTVLSPHPSKILWTIPPVRILISNQEQQLPWSPWKATDWGVVIVQILKIGLMLASLIDRLIQDNLPPATQIIRCLRYR
jgi:hypothetical protein